LCRNILIFLMLLLFSCKSSQVTVSDDPGIRQVDDKDIKNYNYLLSEAIKQKTLGNYKQAVIYYRQCLEIDPSSDAAMFELSSIFTYTGDYEIALGYARKAAATDKGNLWYKLQLAGLYNSLKKKDSSIIVFEDIRLQFPDDLDLKYQLGNMYLEANRNDEALEIFEELEDKVGLQASVLTAKIEIYQRTKNKEKLMLELGKLMKIAGDELKYNLVYAELMYELGEEDEARKKYNDLLLKFSGNEQLRLSMVQYYIRNEDYNKLLSLVDTILLDDAGRIRTGHAWRNISKRCTHQQDATTQARYWYGFPELCPVSTHDSG